MKGQQMNSVIEEIPLAYVSFKEDWDGIHEVYEGQPEGHIYILERGRLIRVIPALIGGRKTFVYDIRHRFDGNEPRQVWRIRPA